MMKLFRENSPSKVVAVNDVYCFALAFDEGQTKLSYLAEIDEELGLSTVTGEEDVSLGFVAAGFYFGEPLHEFIARDGFQITTITATDGELVRIDYLYPSSSMPLVRTTDTYWICDRSRGWARTEAGSVRHYDSGIVDEEVEKIEYGSVIGEVPIATRISLRTVRKDGSHDSELVYRNEVVSTDPNPDLFYLKGYGLPEPNFGSGNSNFLLWLTCFACGAAILLFVLRQRRKSMSL